MSIRLVNETEIIEEEVWVAFAIPLGRKRRFGLFFFEGGSKFFFGIWSNIE